jgi:hypothetical protein
MSSDLKPQILGHFLKKMLPFLQTEAEKSVMDEQDKLDPTTSVSKIKLCIQESCSSSIKDAFDVLFLS